jgi:hypothetical protein
LLAGIDPGQVDKGDVTVLTRIRHARTSKKRPIANRPLDKNCLKECEGLYSCSSHGAGCGAMLDVDIQARRQKLGIDH